MKPWNCSNHKDLLAAVIASCGFSESDLGLFVTINSRADWLSKTPPLGLWRVMFGAYPLITDPSLKTAVAERLSKCKVEDLGRPALEKFSPLGYVAGLHPVLNLQALIAQLSGASDPEQVLANARWNPVHVSMLQETLDLVYATCSQNILSGSDVAIRSAVLGRIRSQFRHLYSGRFHGSPEEFQNAAERFACDSPASSREFKMRRLLALRAQAEAAPETPAGEEGTKATVWEKIPGNWYSNIVATKASPDSSLLRDIINLHDSTPKQRAFLFASVIQELAAEESSTATEATDMRYLRKAAKINQHVPFLSRLRLPGKGGTNCASLEWLMHLIERCNGALPAVGPAAILCTITGAVAPERLGEDSISVHENCALIRTRTRLVNNLAPTDLSVHRETSLTFTSVTTRRVGEIIAEFLKDQGNSAESLRKRADDWLKAQKDLKITLSGLIATLRYNAPLWLSLPAVYYDIGLGKFSEVLPGWRHYLSYRLADFGTPICSFIRAYINGEFAIPDEALLETCGSAYCPEPGSMLSLFQETRHLIESKLPTDRCELIRRSNAIASADRLVETLLTFTRARDAFLPLPEVGLTARSLLARTRIIHEKQHPRVVYYPKALLNYLRASHGRLRAILQALNEGIPHAQSGLAYWFLDDEKPLYQMDCVPGRLPYRLLVSSGLAQCPATEGFAMLHPHGMRNLSNLILRRDRVLPEDAILALHDHFPNRALSPLEFDSLQPPILEQERELAATHLADKLGLSET